MAQWCAMGMAMVLYPALVIGLGLFGWGLWRMYADGRRILYAVSLVGGLGLALVSVSILLFDRGHALLLVTLLLGAGLVVVVSYPVLTIFLILNGITMLRREQRSLGNALSLLAGLGMIGLAVLGALAPQSSSTSPWVPLRLAALMFVELLAGWVAICFMAFGLSSLLYRWMPVRQRPDAIIVLGSGLIDGRVPPLLAGRLAKARSEQLRYSPTPVLITSGGQGADEPLPEGEAMRNHLVAAGTPAELVKAETASRNTRENLILSRRLLADPQAPVLVVTSSYHVFRAAMVTRSVGLNAKVVGAPTASYFYPSALLREFVAVMRSHLRLNLAVVAGLALMVVVLWGALPAVVSTFS